MEKGSKSVVVTGVPGRLSNLVVARLLEEGFTVKAIVKPGLDSRLLPRKVVDRLILDLSEKGEAPRLLLTNFIKGSSTVVALHGLVDYSASKNELFKHNFESTVNLLEASKDAGTVKKFIYTSSTSVYRVPKYLPIDERHPKTPNSHYGESKHAAEEAVVASGLPYVILRPTVMAGGIYYSNFAKFVEAAAKGKAKLIGDGENRMAWVHPSDAAEAFVKAVESKAVNQDFIIASDESVTQKQAYSILCKELGVKPPVSSVSKHTAYVLAKLNRLYKKLIGKKPGLTEENIHTIAEDRYYDSAKAARLLGWKPKVKFEQAVKELAKEYQKHIKK